MYRTSNQISVADCACFHAAFKSYTILISTHCNNVNSENKQNENIQAENNNNQTGENSTPDNTNIATKPDTGVQNNVTTPNNNDGTVANNGTTNNNVTANNGETDNNVTNNTEITTGTNVNEVGETTVTRVEEEEKLVSKDFWDWWTPASVLATAASAVSDTIVPTTPDFTVEKFATIHIQLKLQTMEKKT